MREDREPREEVWETCLAKFEVGEGEEGVGVCEISPTTSVHETLWIGLSKRDSRESKGRKNC